MNKCELTERVREQAGYFQGIPKLYVYAICRQQKLIVPADRHVCRHPQTLAGRIQDTSRMRFLSSYFLTVLYIPLPSKLKTKKPSSTSRKMTTNASCGPFSLLSIRFLNNTEMDELDFTGIEFSVTINTIGKFEHQNNISVNVFGFEDIVFSLYITKEHFDTHMYLLLYSREQPNITASSKI